METKTLKINNIGCNGCVNTIKGELTALSGVKFIAGDVAEKTVTVEYATPAELETIYKTLTEIEYPAEPVQA
jgi:copper chaperone CopZ